MRTGLFFLFASLCAAQQLMVWPVRGTREMVAAANNFEVEAGIRILGQGGNAVDAGVAATLAASVTEQARFGLGGEMPLIVKLHGKTPVVISGVGVAPTGATPGFYRARAAEAWETGGRFPPIPAQGIRAAITPGVFAGLMEALEQHGTMSFTQVAQPAIELTAGFPVNHEWARFIAVNAEVLALWPTSREFFFPGGTPIKEGEVFRATHLGNTLRELAKAEKKARGNRAKKVRAVRDYFYSGPIAKRIADFSQTNGGLITYNDLKNFQAPSEPPKTTTYRGYTVVKPGFWTQGPVMLQMLNILESYDLKSMGHNSPEYLHTLIETVKLGFADRDRHYGDPKFAKIPETVLLSKDYAAARRKLIDPRHASMEHRPGDLGGTPPLPSAGGGSSSGIQDTTCVNVVDRWGNLFNATPSGAWLPSVIAGDTGIPLSTRLQSFVVTDNHPNQIAPGKRPRVTLSPTMVLKDGNPFLIMSTPGGDNQDQAMLQVLLNVIEFGMSAQQAAEAPRFQTEHFETSFAFHEFTPGRVAFEKRIPATVLDQLAGRGHKVEVRGEWSNSSAPTVILVREGVLDGGADPRRGRVIFGR